MIQIKEIISKTSWNAFLELIPAENYPFFQTWNWGEIQKNNGFPIIRLGIYDENKLVGICLVVDINAKRGHYFHLRHGPVLLDFEKYFDPLIGYITKQAQAKNAAFLRISPLLKKDTLFLDFFIKRKFRYAPIHNMDAEICSLLNIQKSEQELLSGMRKSHRYLIKKAKTMTISIRKSTDKKDIENFLQLYEDFSSKKHFVAHKGILEEFTVLQKDDEIALFLATYEEKIIAGILIDYIGPVAIYHHAASNAQYRNIPANYLLLWEAIIEAKKRNKLYFNLWGIAPTESKKHPWSGFTLFKTGFGGERVEFLHAMDLPLSQSYWKTYVIDWITKKRKGY